MEFVQFHPTGMVWPPSVRGILVTEGVRGEGGVLRNNQRRALHVRRHPGDLPESDRQRPRGRLALLPGRQERAAAARAADARPRRPLHHPRGQGGPRQPARRRLPRHRLDQGEDPQRRRAHQAEAAEHVSPVQGAGRRRHHEGADGSRPDDALHHGRRARRRRHADVAAAGPVRLRRVRRRHQRRQPAGRQLALRPARLRQAGRRTRGEVRQGQAPPAAVPDDQIEAAARCCRGAVRASAPTTGRFRSSTTCRR